MHVEYAEWLQEMLNNRSFKVNNVQSCQTLFEYPV